MFEKIYGCIIYNMEEEIWKSIPGYKGLYEVSNMGRVKALERIAARGSKGERHRKEQILKLQCRNLYLKATLCKNGEYKQFQVHRLVAEAFIPNPDGKPVVNHIDGDRCNNQASNLEWVTYRENTQHAIRTGLWVPEEAHTHPVQCVETGEIFSSTAEAGRSVGVTWSAIGRACKDRWCPCQQKHWKYADGGGKTVKVTLILDKFPMHLYEMFEKELSKYVDADIGKCGENALTVTFVSEDVAKAQCGLIICDKYRFGENIDPMERLIEK